jgi:hypothetical protein
MDSQYLVEVAKALKLAEPAIRITAKSLKEAGFLTRIFNEELAPNIALSVPVEAIVRMMCKTIGWENEDQIVAIALEDRFNFQKIDIQKVKAYNKENLNWKIANVVYKENFTLVEKNIFLIIFALLIIIPQYWLIQVPILFVLFWVGCLL